MVYKATIDALKSNAMMVRLGGGVAGAQKASGAIGGALDAMSKQVLKVLIKKAQVLTLALPAVVQVLEQIPSSDN